MLEIFNYPVSGIMKAWHFLLQNVLGMDSSLSWLISIVLLVITVRTLIAPITWVAVRSGRVSAMMRPEKEAIEREYRDATDVDSVAARDKALKDLNKRYRFRPAAGCLPPLIMFPVFIGLYRVVFYMASPDNHGAEANVGMLTPEEIASFRDATYRDVPLTAFPAMPQDWAQSMGVTGEQVFNTILPLLIAAITFTVVNMAMSLYRSYWTTDFSSTVMRRMFYFMIFMGVFLFPWLLWTVATTGPVPVAIVLYWFCSNLYTLLQTISFNWLVHRKYPLEDIHHEVRRRSWKTFRDKKQARKDLKRRKRKARFNKEERAKLQEDLARQKEESQALKARRKEISRAQNKARQEIRKAKLEQAQERARAAKEAKSNNQPEE